MASKKKTRRKVLAASCILAALIIGSSSFAWFTSKDEVVNKLSAYNNYDVTVYEDFTPPPSWTPGQTVEKAVKVVNTGNVDAFVKLSLSNELVLTQYTDGDKTFTESDKDSYIKLTDDQVTSLEAGGLLVYKANIAVTETVGTDFTPTENGFYIFERSNSTTEKYVGFYCVAGDTTDDNVYYAITVTKNTDGGIDKYTIDKTKTETVTDEPTIKFVAGKEAVGDTPATEPYIKVVYGTGDNAITININLDSTELANWERNGATEFFYKKVLGAGKRTGNLVTSVQLDSTVGNDAFVKMDYSLTVTVESAQVVDDEDRQTDEGKAVTAVNGQSWGMTATFDSGDIITGNTAKDDDTVTWALPTP